MPTFGLRACLAFALMFGSGIAAAQDNPLVEFQSDGVRPQG